MGRLSGALCVLLLGVTVVPSQAATAMAGGIGARTCTQYAQDYKRDAQAETAVENIYFNWALGFMSGMNSVRYLFDKQPTKDLNGLPPADQHQRIREYCDQHPTSLYMEAVAAMMGTLPAVPPPQ